MPQTATIRRKGQWRKGQSGNPAGRPPGRHAIAEALRAELDQVEAVDADGNPLTRAEVIAQKAVGMAMDGDLHAIQFVTERLEGKARVTMQVHERQPSIEELRQRVISMIGKDGSGLRRLLGSALPPVIESRDPGVAG